MNRNRLSTQKNWDLKTYGQFCPIARASEILAERWTPIILRNLLLGSRTFNEISAGAPGLSRALLSKRLRELLAPLRGFGGPLLDLVDLRPYTSLQSLADATVPHGWHYYWKSAEIGRLDDAVIDKMVEHSSRIRSPWSDAVMFHLGGAVADVEEEATAYSHRDAAHNININGVWLPHEPVAARESAWTQEFFAALEPHQSGAYVNFLDRDDEARVRSAYGDGKYRRLAALKHRYDPDNVFRLNHNIIPLESADSAPSPTAR